MQGTGVFGQYADVQLSLASVVPSSANPEWTALSDSHRVTFYIHALNATTVTGSAITLAQATDSAGTGTKALGMTKAWTRTGGSGAWTEVAVASDTFTIASTDNLETEYLIEVDEAELDIANDFDYARVVPANATAQTITLMAIKWPLRYS